MKNIELIYKTVADFAANRGNSLSALSTGLGEQSNTNSIVNFAKELCDAFELIEKREAPSQQVEQ